MEDTPEKIDDTEGTRRMGIADSRLTIIEQRAILHSSGNSKESIEHSVDRTLRDLVKTAAEAWKNGELDTEGAGEMILIALEKVDEYKDDDDPATNGEKIAAALAGLPNELIEGPLRDFIEAEGRDEGMELLGEIQRNSPKKVV